MRVIIFLLNFIGIFVVQVLSEEYLIARPLPPYGPGNFEQRSVETLPHEFPWIVSIRISGFHYCSGSVVNEEWVMTAAHCSNGLPSNYDIVAGDHNLNVDEGNEQYRSVVRIIRHPAYGSGVQHANDIALLKVDEPFEFNEYVQPARLPNNSSFVLPQSSVLIGWDESESGLLMKSVLPILSDEACRAFYEGIVIPESMICAGGANGSCHSDSGSPLICEGQNEDGVRVQYVCGIVSWSHGCDEPTSPVVNTEISYFNDWVQKVLLPPIENNDTWVENYDCGGVLSGSSGYINYKAGHSYLANETCTWIIQASDRENIRVRLRNDGLASDALITVTEIDFTNAVTTNTTRLIDFADKLFRGPVIFVTFMAGAEVGTGFDLEFYGTNYDFSTGLRFTNIHINKPIGLQIFPEIDGGGYYENNAFATFVINPTGSLGSRARLQFTRMGIEEDPNFGCLFDWVRVNALSFGEFQPIGLKHCGTKPTPEIFESNDGVLILLFRSDISVNGTGFDFANSAW